MASNRKIVASVDLLVRNRSLVIDAYSRAIKDALRKHKQAGNSVAVFQNGKVILLPPNEIRLD
jgi:hypothetical protein